MRDIVVVKLGGSHAASPGLREFLQALPPGRTVVVPGGGPFADAVRAAQGPMGYDDAAAHDMALMAMAQFGRALSALTPALVYADHRRAMSDALDDNRVAVWSPWPGLRGHPDIAASWDVTSDSLAVWLAREIDARAVVLVKHTRPVARDVARWVRDHVVDAAFESFRARFKGEVHIATMDDLAAVRV